MDGAPCILLVGVGRPSFDGTVAYARVFRVLFFCGQRGYRRIIDATDSGPTVMRSWLRHDASSFENGLLDYNCLKNC